MKLDNAQAKSSVPDFLDDSKIAFRRLKCAMPQQKNAILRHSDSSLWATNDGIDQINHAASSFTFSEARASCSETGISYLRLTKSKTF